MSNGRLRWLACVVFLLAFAASAEAQVAGGGMRLGLAGNITVPEGGDPVMMNIISASYFSRFEGGVRIGVFTSGGVNSGDVFGELKYNFIGESLFVPFLHVGIGTQLAGASQGGSDFSTNSTLFNYGGGFKAFINERASFDVTGSLQTITTSIDTGGSSQSGSSTGFSMIYGLSLYFGG